MTSADLPPSSPPLWLGWLGTGLTAMLAVLFLVLVQQLRGQNEQLQRLEAKVQALQNARALERTDALEQQVHNSASRLQALEALRGDLQRLSAQQQRLQADIQQLNRREPGALPPLPPAITAPGQPPVRPGTPGNG